MPTKDNQPNLSEDLGDTNNGGRSGNRCPGECPHANDPEPARMEYHTWFGKLIYRGDPESPLAQRVGSFLQSMALVAQMVVLGYAIWRILSWKWGQ